MKSQVITEHLHNKVVHLMGSRFEISIVSDDEQWAENLIESAILEIRRIEHLLTTFSNRSETKQINAYAGIKPVKVNKEVFDLIKRAIKISELTHGAFDITNGSVDNRLWNLDKTISSSSGKEATTKIFPSVNYNNIVLNKKACTVFLKEKGMRIGFGTIGKGYAADRAKLVLQQNGVASGVVNVSGDLTTWGMQPNGKPWTAGIANPALNTSPFSYVNISGMAAATSANRTKYTISQGHGSSENPANSIPISAIKSLTIIGASAELTDALATPVMAMGIPAGLDLINQIEGMGCIIIDEYDHLYTSKKIHIN